VTKKKKTAALSVSRATVSEVMSTYTNHGKTTSAKRNSGRKSTLTERDRRTLRRTVSKITELLQHSRIEYSS
jgi:transposase